MSCWECGVTDVPIHDHHVVPRSKGGTKTVPLCESCHSKVHGHSMRISKLVKAGIKRRKDSGKRYGSILPFGYELSDDGETLIPNRRERLVLDIVRSLRSNGFLMKDIAAALTESGYTNRNGAPYSTRAIGKILNCEV